MHAATVNPTDLILRAGTMPLRGRSIPGPPHVPRMDAAGVIDEVGPGGTVARPSATGLSPW
ncbi:alcohol dehydrogenase catalytic domain-containing protein [Nocardia sp. NPDC004278]